MKLYERLQSLSRKDRDVELKHISLRAVPEVYEKLEALTKALGESQNWVLTHLVYAAHDEMVAEAMSKGGKK